MSQPKSMNPTNPGRCPTCGAIGPNFGVPECTDPFHGTISEPDFPSLGTPTEIVEELRGSEPDIEPNIADQTPDIEPAPTGIEAADCHICSGPHETKDHTAPTDLPKCSECNGSGMVEGKYIWCNGHGIGQDKTFCPAVCQSCMGSGVTPKSEPSGESHDSYTLSHSHLSMDELQAEIDRLVEQEAISREQELLQRVIADIQQIAMPKKQGWGVSRVGTVTERAAERMKWYAARLAQLRATNGDVK